MTSTTTSREAFRFFHEHAGYVVGKRAIGALELARAEAWLAELEQDERARFFFEHDPEPFEYGAGDDEYVRRQFESGAWTGPYGAVLEIDGEQAGSLWGITFGPRDTGDPYARVVRAELALEAKDEHDRETLERDRAARQDIATAAVR